jgi:hypothetical protein
MDEQKRCRRILVVLLDDAAGFSTRCGNLSKGALSRFLVEAPAQKSCAVTKAAA